MSNRSVTLDQLRTGTPYVAYSYAYPHKTAYRPLDPARPLKDVWSAEDKSSLFLYVHVPFCEMRCGFCNLFTTANPNDQRVEQYLAALWRQARAIGKSVGPVSFARGAIGGGTPTYLNVRQLERLFCLLRDVFALDPTRTPISVETSPRTADAQKLRLLKDQGISRISIGVQSLVEAEVAAAGRAQKEAWVRAAIECIRAAQVPIMNIDLIYGLPGQTVESWARSLAGVLEYRPEELYLYPLYVRPLTGLDRRGKSAEDRLRLECYRQGRLMLLEAGYQQLSMRMFRSRHAPDTEGPVYCCQDDGMLGLGCGARSYTRDMHYSCEYAVGARAVRDILAGYERRTDEEFSRVDFGCQLDEDEQRRRWVIKSLLRAPGLNIGQYRSRFGREAADDFPEFGDLLAGRWIERDGPHVLRLTEAGMERSDSIGPLFYSPAMCCRMHEYEAQ